MALPQRRKASLSKHEFHFFNSLLVTIHRCVVPPGCVETLRSPSTKLTANG
jgi:hypothetical protein